MTTSQAVYAWRRRQVRRDIAARGVELIGIVAAVIVVAGLCWLPLAF